MKLNGARAKSSREVKEGDLLSIRNRGRITTVRVIKIPLKPPSKKDASLLYETVTLEPLNDQL